MREVEGIGSAVGVDGNDRKTDCITFGRCPTVSSFEIIDLCWLFNTAVQMRAWGQTLLKSGDGGKVENVFLYEVI